MPFNREKRKIEIKTTFHELIQGILRHRSGKITYITSQWLPNKQKVCGPGNQSDSVLDNDSYTQIGLEKSVVAVGHGSTCL